jgi:hypothetical protein
MAICPDCQQEMRTTHSCRPALIEIGGRLYKRITWGKETRFGPRNPDFACGCCGAPPGGIHHRGCDVEECPSCRRQGISCDCGDQDACDHLWRRARGDWYRQRRLGYR